MAVCSDDVLVTLCFWRASVKGHVSKKPVLPVFQSDISPEDSQMHDWIVTAARSKKFSIVLEGGVNSMFRVTDVSVLNTQTSPFIIAMQVLPILKQQSTLVVSQLTSGGQSIQADFSNKLKYGYSSVCCIRSGCRQRTTWRTQEMT